MARTGRAVQRQGRAEDHRDRGHDVDRVPLHAAYFGERTLGLQNLARPIIIVAWIAQTFLQLVLLPIIIVGQNGQAAAADERSMATYNDASAVLEEAKQIQAQPFRSRTPPSSRSWATLTASKPS